MDRKNIREYAKLMKELDLTGLEITDGNVAIRLERSNQNVSYLQNDGKAASPYTPCSESETEKTIEIKSPMVGIFYDAAKESDEPFVKCGDRVKKGDILCIIEAMKLINEITAGQDGIITEICAVNNQSVEFGTVLFRIGV